jgi:hypothetical protein
MASYTYEVDKKSFVEMFKDLTDGKDATDDDFDKFCVLFGDGGKRAFGLAEEALDMWANQCVNDVASAREDAAEEDEWEEVYNAGEADKNAKPQLFKDVKGDSWPQYNDFKYYQTYGGGPEGGYITDGTILAKVYRNWDIPFSVKVVNGTLVFRHGDWKEGRPNQVKVTGDDSSSADSDFDECEWCDYVHNYEDKCPKGQSVKHYVKWRK